MNSHDAQPRKCFNLKTWIIIAIIVTCLIALLFWFNSSNKKEAISTQKETSSSSPKAALTIAITQPEQQNWQQYQKSHGWELHNELYTV